MLHGTTTLGFIFQGGVIICVDSRASQGQYVGASLVHLSFSCHRLILKAREGLRAHMDSLPGMQALSRSRR